jgi:ankyrin repeat protein
MGASRSERCLSPPKPAHIDGITSLLWRSPEEYSQRHALRNHGSRREKAPTPLLIAVEHASPEAVRWLLQEGADANQRHSDIGLKGSALYIAISKNRLNIAEILRRGGADLDLPDTNGAPIIDMAIQSQDNIRALQWFLKHGADATCTNSVLSTPLHIAARIRKNASTMMDMLVGAGADVNARNKRGNTPTYNALSWGHVDNIRHLITLGAEVNIQNSDGDTPLHAYVESELALSCAHILFSASADPTARNNNNKTFADLARSQMPRPVLCSQSESGWCVAARSVAGGLGPGDGVVRLVALGGSGARAVVIGDDGEAAGGNLSGAGGEGHAGGPASNPPEAILADSSVPSAEYSEIGTSTVTSAPPRHRPSQIPPETAPAAALRRRVTHQRAQRRAMAR